VAAVVDRADTTNGVRLYVDGNLVFTGAPLSGDLDNTSDLFMGVRTPGQGGGGFFAGCLDEVELIKRALTQQEIQAIFQAGSAGKCKPQCVPPPADLVAWWPLDETSGATTLQDIIGGNNATPNASPVGAAQAPSSVSGKVGGAIQFGKFSGGLSSAQVSPSSALKNIGAGDFTIDAWIKVDGPLPPVGSPIGDPLGGLTP
jgi:hypothetical protein